MGEPRPKTVSESDERMRLERAAARINTKADTVAAEGNHKEAQRLRLLAECMWPSDPVQRLIDDWERGELAAKYGSKLNG